MSSSGSGSDNGVCKRIVVQEGDSCPILALKYPVEVEEIESFNPGNFCGPTWPTAGQVICMSPGYLPPTPQMLANGTCATFTVPQNATCATIASSNAFTIQVSQIQEYNNQTCSSSFPIAGSLVCLSKGSLPPSPSLLQQGNPSVIAVPICIAAIALILLVGLMLWHCKRQSRSMEMEGVKGGKSSDLNLMKQRWFFSQQPKLAKPRDDRRRDTLIMIV